VSCDLLLLLLLPLLLLPLLLLPLLLLWQKRPSVCWACWHLEGQRQRASQPA
jgi:hypothetical protein